MQNLSRSINIGFRVNQEEYDLVHGAMKLAGFNNLRSYLLKMAVNGRIINLELNCLSDCARLLRNISNNINQIAVRANSGGNIYAADIEEIKARQDEIWAQQEVIVKTLAKIMEVA